MDASQRAGQIADQMEIVEPQDGIERPLLGREGLCGRGAEDKRRNGTSGVFPIGDRDHPGGNIRRKIALYIACKPQRRCSGSAAQFQHPVV